MNIAKAKYNHLTLSVYQKNTRAIGFYKKQGFQAIKQRIDENTGEMEVYMSWKR